MAQTEPTTLASIVYKPKNAPKSADAFTRQPLTEATLVAGYGIEGDAKGGHPKRQLNIMSSCTMDALAAQGLKVQPGELGEQLIFDGLCVDDLAPGAQLSIADAVVEVVEARTGCDRFEHIQGTSKDSVRGQLGVIAKVVRGGRVAVGDEVRLVQDVTAG